MRWRALGAVVGAAVAVAALAGAVAVVQARSSDHGRRVVGDLPTPAAGQRWVGWRDVAVQVPAGWGYGHEPDDQWCADAGDRDDPSAPYVALSPGYGFHTEVGCPLHQGHARVFGPAPEKTWAEHLTLRSPQGPDGTWHDRDWTLVARTLGDVQLSVLTRDAAVADTILATARTVAVDEAGCAVSSPAQSLAHVRPDPVDLATIDVVDAISLCQYDRTVPISQPGFMASARLSGDAASAYLHALRAAPVGGGPDDPEDCAADQTEGTAVVVRLWSGRTPHDLIAYYDWCRGNGIDDGTHLLTLTRDTCSPLFGTPPVTLWQSQQDLAGLCYTALGRRT